MNIELVICTHNPNQEYLQRTVEGLRAQTLPTDQWGFLIVDNSSSPPVESAHVDWHPHGRVVVETELGLTPARICGIRRTRSDWIVFVDDDNVLAPDYLQQVLELSGQHPSLGAFGAARIIPEFEVEPDHDCRPFIKGLALRELDVSLWSNNPEDTSNPWGAGLVVRRSVAEEFDRRMSGSTVRKMLGRKGDSLNSAEDIEFAWIACDQGFSKGIFPELRIRHLIDRRRVDRNYLARICEGHAFSHTLMKYLHHQDIVRRSDRIARPNSSKSWSSPRFGVLGRVRNAMVWVLAKAPGFNRNFSNRARLAVFRGIQRAGRLIDELEAERVQQACLSESGETNRTGE